MEKNRELDDWRVDFEAKQKRQLEDHKRHIDDRLQDHQKEINKKLDENSSKTNEALTQFMDLAKQNDAHLKSMISAQGTNLQDQISNIQQHFQTVTSTFSNIQNQIQSLQQSQSILEESNLITPDAKRRKDKHLLDMSMGSPNHNRDSLAPSDTGSVGCQSSD